MTAVPENPTPVAPKEHDTTRQRVLAVASWLVDGKLRPECVALAMKEWTISRRTAQVYVARAAHRIARMTEFDDPLFAMKLSQMQRDRLFQELQELLRRGEVLPLPHWKMKIQTIQATLKMLDSRDRTAAKIAQLESKSGRTAEHRRVKHLAEPVQEIEKTLRHQPPPQPALPKTNPKPEPRPLPVSPAMKEHARAVIFEGAAPPTANVSIVPQEPKGRLEKELRQAQRPATPPAPGGISCALETRQGAELSRPAQRLELVS